MSLQRQYLSVALYCTLAHFAAPQAFSAATVSIPNAPATIQPGQSVTINTQFSKTADETEKRVIIRLDLYDADTHTKVSGAIADNSGAGFTGSSASVPCTITIPADASGSYYFKSTVAPWSLNRAIVAKYKSYPTNGTYTYRWTSGYGVTRDVRYLGALAAPASGDNTCYCSGLAFETFVFAFNEYNATYGHTYIGNIRSDTNMETFRRLWYGVSDKEKLAARAIPEWVVGREITDREEAQEGDFVQLWRNPYGTDPPSGHNPLFVSWRRTSGAITGVNYWGTQSSTSGIGYRGENFGTSSGSMNTNRFYIGRAAKPRDQADYDWALGQASTQATPSTINSGINDWFLY